MLSIGDKVEVYWNLHKKCYSVRHDGRVVMHTNKLALRDVRFSVQPAGRQKVIANKQKNVHAFVRGLYAGKNFAEFSDCGTLATYNPYKYDSFVDVETQKPIYNCEKAFLTMKFGLSIPNMLIKKGN